MKHRQVRSALLAALMLWTAPVWAQSRPLSTEDPEVVGPGQILAEGGIEFAQDAFFPLSGLRGRLWRVGTFGLSFGVSPLAEIQLDGGVQNFLAIQSRLGGPLAGMVTAVGDRTHDFEDVVIGAKIRFLAESETSPAVSVKFSTRLPNAGNESGLGLDTTDFAIQFLIGKTVRSVRFVGNAGMAILSDPARGDRQNDVVIYGFSGARAIATGIEVVGEVNGRWSTRRSAAPIGTDTSAQMRVGARLTRGPVRLDGGLTIGITQRDPTWGITAGATWVFTAFTVK